MRGAGHQKQLPNDVCEIVEQALLHTFRGDPIWVHIGYSRLKFFDPNSVTYKTRPWHALLQQLCTLTPRYTLSDLIEDLEKYAQRPVASQLKEALDNDTVDAIPEAGTSSPL